MNVGLAVKGNVIFGGIIFVLADERWAAEIPARPETRASEDHHGLCKRRCPPQESRECLEAELET